MVSDLVRECLDVDPAKRPTMEVIIHRLVVGLFPQCSCFQTLNLPVV